MSEPKRVETTDRFAAELAALVTAAHRNGVAVEGGWLVRTPEDVPNWDVEIWRVEESDASEDERSADDVVRQS